MTDDILHTIDFIERDEYIRDNEDDTYFGETVYGISAETRIPVPNEGDVVEFGWYEDEDSGEEVHHIDVDRTGVEYHRTRKYKVVDIDHHYHHSLVESEYESTFAVNRIEVSTTIIMQPHERTKWKGPR